MQHTFTKQKIAVLCFSVFLMLTCVFSAKAVAKDYVFKWSNIKEIEVTAQSLNIRTGPGTSFTVIGTLSQGDKVSVVGTLGSWYVIHTSKDMIGVISSTYTRVLSYYNNTTTTTPDTPKTTTPAPTTGDAYGYKVTTDEQKMIDLINSERSKNGLAALTVDMEAMRVARIKAEDLSKNQYFSHQSPTYGSPFDMLKKFNVSYTSAGENIAGNSTVEAAHTALMNSSGHRANILGSSYTHIGIGIYQDSRYGKVFAQIFIGK
ncbi:MAG: SH3 domain-containing protein [Vallitaleaceae bacterium]|nr:SH3 domain-containing protein [Vallitaleaceae bacterium]